MEFIAPIPFDEAIQKLGDQSVIGSTLTAGEWGDLPVELRDNAFFSSRIESAQFLQRAQDALGDFIAGNRKLAANGEPMLATGSRAAFVDQMKKFLEAEGVKRTTGDLKDITSEKRLGLIFDIKTRQAQDFGYWLQGMNPDILNEFPAQRFIRVQDVKEPRELHERFQDQVYLKTDPIWWLEINKDFGVPWGPWGWGCGHDVEDVDRDEAESLGLIKPGQKLSLGPLAKFLNINKGLQASVKNLAPELVEKLQAEFGGKIILSDGLLRWRGQPVADSQGEALTPAEKLALNNYTRATYRVLNRNLRDGDQSAYTQDTADTLTQALAKLNPYEGKVERGDTLPTKTLDDQYQVGNVVIQKQFWSTSRTIPFPGNVLFTIESKSGRRIARYSSHRAETEVLFDQGSMFRVLSRAFVDGVWQINLEEL